MASTAAALVERRAKATVTKARHNLRAAMAELLKRDFIYLNAESV
jgi:hypothetical protein